MDLGRVVKLVGESGWWRIESVEEASHRPCTTFFLCGPELADYSRFRVGIDVDDGRVEGLTEESLAAVLLEEAERLYSASFAR